MLLADLLGWWYLRGWGWLAQEIFRVEIGRVLHFFSIGDLLKTLFAPFRQDAIQLQNAPIGVRLQAFGGNIISRFFGFIIRSVLIIIGLIAAITIVIVGAILMVLWPLIPIMPLIALVLIFFEAGI